MENEELEIQEASQQVSDGVKEKKPMKRWKKVLTAAVCTTVITTW